MPLDLAELQEFTDKPYELLSALEWILIEHEAALILAVSQALEPSARKRLLKALVDVSRQFRRELREQIEQLQKARRREALRQEE